MKITSLKTATLFAVIIVLLMACSKPDDILHPIPTPAPAPPAGAFSIRLQAAITIGDVLYDSIPARFTITTWNANNVAQQKDTMLSAGAQIIYLPKNAIRYRLALQKWGIADEKILSRSEVVDGALYQLGGHREAKKLQWITEEMFVNGAPTIIGKQQIVYDAEGRINEVHAYAPDPNTGLLTSGSMDIFLYGANELWVNTVRKSDGVLFSHSAYTFDAQGRTVRSKFQYLTQTQQYTNLYSSEGILMLMGANASDVNGNRIALKFAGGNRVEEKTVFVDHPTTVKTFRYDFNINPLAVIKMPAMYFEHSSKNNVIAEYWEGSDQLINEYTYDAEGYVTVVTTRIRNNNGQFDTYSKTSYSY